MKNRKTNGAKINYDNLEIEMATETCENISTILRQMLGRNYSPQQIQDASTITFFARTLLDPKLSADDRAVIIKKYGVKK